MKFEWDEAKNEDNIRKHGFDFADAAEVFEFPLLTGIDSREDYAEHRFVGIGFLRQWVVVVVFVGAATIIQSVLSLCERR